MLILPGIIIVHKYSVYECNMTTANLLYPHYIIQTHASREIYVFHSNMFIFFLTNGRMDVNCLFTFAILIFTCRLF
jgi:hypothetical protein